MKHAAKRLAGSATLITSLALFAGCATAAPSESMESSTSSIRAAQEVGASKVPEAALHLQLAREQSEHARVLMEKGGDDDIERAESLLLRAQADAELALALAREDDDRTAAQQAVDNVHAMQTHK